MTIRKIVKCGKRHSKRLEPETLVWKKKKKKKRFYEIVARVLIWRNGEDSKEVRSAGWKR